MPVSLETLGAWHKQRHPRTELPTETHRVALWMINQVRTGHSLKRTLKRAGSHYRAAGRVAREYLKEVDDEQEQAT